MGSDTWQVSSGELCRCVIEAVRDSVAPVHSAGTLASGAGVGVLFGVSFSDTTGNWFLLLEGFTFVEGIIVLGSRNSYWTNNHILADAAFLPLASTNGKA